MPDLPLPDAETATERWGAMLLVRRFEERSRELYAKGLIAGFLHSAAGEEAAIVGALRALDPGDAALSTFRAHAHALVRGTPPGAVMAALLRRARGRGDGRAARARRRGLRRARRRDARRRRRPRGPRRLGHPRGACADR